MLRKLQQFWYDRTGFEDGDFDAFLYVVTKLRFISFACYAMTIVSMMAGIIWFPNGKYLHALGALVGVVVFGLIADRTNTPIPDPPPLGNPDLADCAKTIAEWNERPPKG